RTIDGSGNNVTDLTNHPEHFYWGSAGTDLLRTAAAQYGDGISTPAGANRPSAREISNAIAAHPDDKVDEAEVINDRTMADYIYAWGQFLDHDPDLTTTQSHSVAAFDISVPKNDPFFSQAIPFSRSVFDTATGPPTTNPRQQINLITAWIDASMVYGSDTTRAAALRTGSGGKLKTSAGDLPPFNTAGLANANDSHRFADNQLFLAGDVRANHNVNLTPP